MARLARGHGDGIQQFDATRDAFLTSLAPLIAFALVGCGLVMLGGGGMAAASALLAALCMFVAPLVLSFEVARLWQRQDFWLRFATAFNWCQWVIPAVGFVLLELFGALAALGLPSRAASTGFLLGLLSYALWLHWFLARHGLGLSGLRALLLVFAVNLATAILVVGPRVIALGTAAS